MRLCDRHWEELKDKLGHEGNYLLGNLLVMQELINKLGHQVYEMQKENPDGCPVCFVNDDTIIDKVVEVIRKEFP